MSTLTLDKRADLAGPGIGDYNELEKASLSVSSPVMLAASIMMVAKLLPTSPASPSASDEGDAAPRGSWSNPANKGSAPKLRSDTRPPSGLGAQPAADLASQNFLEPGGQDAIPTRVEETSTIVEVNRDRRSSYDALHFGCDQSWRMTGKSEVET